MNATVNGKAFKIEVPPVPDTPIYGKSGKQVYGAVKARVFYKQRRHEQYSQIAAMSTQLSNAAVGERNRRAAEYFNDAFADTKKPRR